MKKHEIMKVKFRVHRELVSETLRRIENFCDSTGITYTYSVKHKFWPMRYVVEAEFEGMQEYMERLEQYLNSAHGIF